MTVNSEARVEMSKWPHHDGDWWGDHDGGGGEHCDYSEGGLAHEKGGGHQELEAEVRIRESIIIIIDNVFCFRYFILKSDGQLLGYKSKPATSSEPGEPCNNFTVKVWAYKYLKCFAHSSPQSFNEQYGKPWSPTTWFHPGTPWFHPGTAWFHPGTP